MCQNNPVIKSTKKIETIALGSMSPGTQRFLKAHRYGREGARPKAYFQASIHADEIAGMMAAHHLLALLDEADRRGEILGEIVVVPVANPIGLAQVLNRQLVGRSDLRGGGNFNRGWPDLTEGAFQALEGRLTGDADANVAVIRRAFGEALAGLSPDTEFPRLRLALSRLAYDADFVVDMHNDDESLFHIFANPQHWPDLSDLAAWTGARAVLLADDSGGASFDEAFSTPWTKLAGLFGAAYPIPAACRSVTLEFRGSADVSDELGRGDAAALGRFLQGRGLLAGEPGPRPSLLCEATALDACDIPRTPRAGVVAYRVGIGDEVRKGDVLADVIDPLADDPASARAEIRCEASGLVLSRRAQKFVAPGDSIAKVVGKEKLAYRKGQLLED
jgi:predicted deacylase